MIKGSELLTNCDPYMLTLAKYLEAKFTNIIITSGYRSPEYNKKIGGVSDSQHCLGKAIDVFVQNVSPIKVAAFVMDTLPNVKGFGIDVYKNYCHLDIREEKTIWVYDRNGKAL